MPRGRNGVGKGRDSCLFPFHNVIASALVAGVSGILVSPNMSLTARGFTEADAWGHFRVRKLMFRLHPQGTGNTLQVAGYIGAIVDNTPTTAGQVAELIPSTCLGGDSSVPTEWVNVPKSDLAGPLPWYKTVPGTADSTEESPGAIYVAGTGSDSYALEVRGIFEFKTALNTSNTPMAVMLRERVRAEKVRLVREAERARLLRVLGTTTEIPSKSLVP